jgi:hypothetical protein
MRILISLCLFILSTSVHADVFHERVRRVTVFPLKVDADNQSVAESTWWDLREHLTESKRFLVASKNFMQAKDVFQSRDFLQPADALILGRLLDANALITTFLVQRKLSMRAYETKNGLILWEGDIELHPAVPVSKQLPDAARKLLYDFMASIPYQGFVSIDSMIGKAWYMEGERQFFKADIGLGTQVTVGDTAQLIRIKAEKFKPLFQEGSTIEVFAEGKVTQVDRNIITVQVSRKLPGEDIAADQLVRIPDELRRIKEIYGMHESSDKNIDIQYFSGPKDELTTKEKEVKPLIASLSWIGNIALILLLAF